VLSRTGEFAGTPHYMSPEQVTSRKKGVDRRTDIYSLGVTLYEILTLRKPIEGHTSYDILKKIPTSDPLEPQKANPRIPRDLSIICLKAMEKQPEKRYHTMKEFAEDLNRFLNGEVILANPVGPATRIMNRAKRYPFLSGTIGVALVATISLILSIPWYILQITRERDRVLRLSDTKVLADMFEEEEMLWPAYPRKIQAMKTWLKKAEELQDRYIIHSQTLNELRSTARVETGTDGSGQNYIFNNIDDQWQHDTLEELVSGMNGLFDEKSGLIRNVKNRLHFAETVRHESIEKHEKEWDLAIASIANEQVCPEYEGLVIEPMIGLVPIGQDPDSELWEFAHLQTGKIPERGPENELIITEEIGLVFVLIPGGTFVMGAQNDDPRGLNYDSLAEKNEFPPHEVSLESFLISKYEMTQGQWLRFTKENPSYFKPETACEGKKINLLHPVEHVNWDDCNRCLFRLNLRLPAEAEWEYATRAGTDTVWWTGNEKESLEGSVNLCDLFCRKFGGQPHWTCEIWLDDGFVVHAPVGRFLPNHFGLHDVYGNVWEWCHDEYTSSYRNTPVTDSQFNTAGSGQVIRGGGWGDDSKACRSACRGRGVQDSRDYLIGLRPAASLQ
jgi:formylglycine-generating enzyme required for sulfatase activity